ncbi:hypothetical protein [Rhizobium sullae]|uniref:GNAT family N-acetyltransferase n=1 Tax=Rhizobium sullae TaxID=50338 RepID=A0A4R3QL59_RHISU|nr:hypothetical protein [Rhizobium sullae]TCU19016.1 hypothetical protein EV132_102245 [Rhizobium sullae]
MKEHSLGRPIIHAARRIPERNIHEGLSVSLEPLSGAHVEALWSPAANAPSSFDYLRYGPFSGFRQFREFVASLAARWAVRPKISASAEGWLSLCDIYAENSSTEIGSIWFSPRLQRTRAARDFNAMSPGTPCS